MAARKRRTLSRTIDVSRIRNGRVYFWRAAWRTISKSRLTSGCVSKSCSCGCGFGSAALRAMLLRSPIKVLLGVELSFRNVSNLDFVSHNQASLGASHDGLLLRAESKRKNTRAEYRDMTP